MKSKLKPPGTNCLKPKCDILLSTSPFEFNLRRYSMGSHGTHPCVRCPIAARDLNDTSKIWPLSGEGMGAMKQLAAAAKLRHMLQGKGELNDAEKTKVTNASLGYNAEDLSRMDIWCHQPPIMHQWRGPVNVCCHVMSSTDS